jgi:hypothetical protein
MNLKQSYEFLRLIVEGEIETWEARDRATGKRVLVHLLLAGDAAANKKNVERISDLCKQNHELIAVGLDAEIPFVVTGTAFGSVGLREWSRIAESAAMPTQVWQRSPQQPPAAPAVMSPGVINAGNIPKPAAGGEFTRFFQSPATPGGEQRVSHPIAPDPPAKPAAPGEFTRIFQSPDRPGLPTDEGKRAPDFAPVQQQNGAPPQPGEFTRFFQSPYASPSTGKTTPDNSGESEGFFSPQPPPSPAPNPLPSSLASRPPASPAGSEFTQVFQRSSTALPTNPELKSFTPMPASAENPLPPMRPLAAEPDVKPPTPPAAGDFTRIFNPGPRSIPDPAKKVEQKIEERFEPPRMTFPYATPPVAPPSVAPAPVTEAGDYTRVIGSSQAPKIQAPKVEAPVQMPPREVPAVKAASVKVKAKKTAMPLPLLAVLLGLLLLAVLIVAFFAIRR